MQYTSNIIAWIFSITTYFVPIFLTVDHSYHSSFMLSANCINFVATLSIPQFFHILFIAFCCVLLYYLSLFLFRLIYFIFFEYV